MTKENTKAHYWGSHIAAWQRSGLSQRVYCLREGIGFSAFGYWRQKKSTSKREAPAKKQAKPTKQATKGLTLVPIQLAPNDSPLILRSTTGWELHLPATVDPTLLTSVLKSLT